MNRPKIAALAAAAALLAGSLVHAFGDGGANSAVKLDYSGSITCYVRVADLDRSIRWYQETLGLELLFKVDAIGWCELKSPVEKVTIGLLKAEKGDAKDGAKTDAKGGATVVFGVKDVDAARRALETAGVRFTGPTLVHEGYVKLAAFVDPDGNLFTLSQPLAPKEGSAR